VGLATSPPPARRAPAPSASVPRRAPGLALLGEVQGSGHRTPPALVRRPDGQTIQLSRLLYLVLDAADGEHTYAEVAASVSAAYGRLLTADGVRRLCETKLRPLGLLLGEDGTAPDVARANPLLALRLKWVVADARITRRLTAPFVVLFAAPVVLAVLVAFTAISAWVLFTKGLASATYQAFDQPLLLLAVFAITILSAGFHELGHAAACRRGGATPGAMGTGLYLVWPAFYTDVTDSYRLGRGGRLRVDLGGLYFNAVVVVAIAAVWVATRYDALLLVIAAQLLQMVRQLAPMIRFDGYHALADLTGVPDLYGRIVPTLRSLVPGRHEPRAAELKPWARAVVTAWVLAVVPVLLVTMALMVLALPRVLGTAWHALGTQLAALTTDWAEGDVAGVGVRMLAVVAVALPVTGTVLILTRVARRATTSIWRRTRGRPAQRAVAVVLGGALVAGLAWAWWPDANRYRPVQPFEQGTVLQAARTVVQRSPRLTDGTIVEAPRTVWAATTPLPTSEHPQLAMVLVPHGSPATQGAGSSSAPTWVFPFNHPAPPGSGDNQALAVNTTDGSTVYDIAFALVWADGDHVMNTNEAYAFASCTACRTVAVAFQVVLVVGSASVVVPQNLAGTVNYSCIACVTYALAQQLVLSIPDTLSPQVRARLDALWAQITAYAATLRNVPLDQIRTQLLAFQDEITAIVKDAATTAAPTPSTTSTGAPSTTQPGTAPTSGATVTPTAPDSTGGSSGTGTSSQSGAASGSTPTGTVSTGTASSGATTGSAAPPTTTTGTSTVTTSTGSTP
jgi:putative peptide zinc metalloprotease protein